MIVSSALSASTSLKINTSPLAPARSRSASCRSGAPTMTVHGSGMRVQVSCRISAKHPQQTRSRFCPTKSMKLIKCIIRPNKVEEVREALEKASVSGMTITEVRGHGRQKGHKAVYRGREYDVSLLPKTMIEMAVSDELVDEVIARRHEHGAHRRHRRWTNLGVDDRGGLQHPDGGKRHVRDRSKVESARLQFRLFTLHFQ